MALSDVGHRHSCLGQQYTAACSISPHHGWDMSRDTLSVTHQQREVPGRGIFTEEVAMPRKAGGVQCVLTQYQQYLFPLSGTPDLHPTPAPRCLITALSVWSWLEEAAAPASLSFPLSWAKSKGLCQLCRGDSTPTPTSASSSVPDLQDSKLRRL